MSCVVTSTVRSGCSGNDGGQPRLAVGVHVRPGEVVEIAHPDVPEWGQVTGGGDEGGVQPVLDRFVAVAGPAG